MPTDTGTRTHDQIREYYGRVLSGSHDLETNACCTADGMPAYLREIVGRIAPEVLARFYGCGSPIPEAIEGCRILDLGCGTGRDAFTCAQLVGERGEVIGLDMTEEQLLVARRHEGGEALRMGLATPNTRFETGYMEDLAAAGVEDDSVDVVISNCVLNLAPDKERVFKEILRVLRPGGEILFADIFSDRRLPRAWMDDPMLVGECLAGAMYTEDFRRLLAGLGVPDVRTLGSREITIDNPAVEAKVGSARFLSITIRAFKLDSLEDRCEDYGQVATYLGTIPHHPHRFMLDDHHVFETGRPMLVCGNTAAMISETRLGSHFETTGDRSTHFGLFTCESTAGAVPPGEAVAPCC